MVNISVFTSQHLSCIYFDILLKTQHVKATCNTTDPDGGRTLDLDL